MGLGSISWLKKELRNNERLRSCMHYPSTSKARRHEKPKGQRDVGAGVEAGFQVVMVELMLKKYSMITGCQHIQQFSKRWRDLVAEQVQRFPDAHTFVFLLDDETNVPQAKSQTQAKRRSGKPFTAEEKAALGTRFQRLCNSDPNEFEHRIGQLFSSEAQDRGKSPFEIFMAKHMATSELREDEFEFATRCIVAGAYKNLGPGRRILIDRGVWRPSFARDIRNDPVEGDHQAWATVVRSFRSGAEVQSRQSLAFAAGARGMAQPHPMALDENASSRAWILIDRWGVRRLDDMDHRHLIGEADLKIPHYVRLFVGQRIFILCKDTDEIPILLLAIKDWLPPHGRFQGQIYLDVTDRSDDKPNPPRKSVIDMLQLWRNLHRWFADKYNMVCNPIEVFCFLLIMGHTDFVDNPKRMAAITIWKAFNRFEARKHLFHSIVVDGYTGAAWPATREVAHMLTGEYFAKARSCAQATQCCLDLLTRDLFSGSYFKQSQKLPGPQHFPKHRRAKHISIYQRGVVRFIKAAYDTIVSGDATRWSDDREILRLVRQYGWNLAYWYRGDTRDGRQWLDEMTQYGPDPDASVYGWSWMPNPNASTQPSPAIQSPPVPRKPKAGCLGRKRPRGMISCPSKAVVSIKVFRAWQQQQAQQTPQASQASHAEQSDIAAKESSKATDDRPGQASPVKRIKV